MDGHDKKQWEFTTNPKKACRSTNHAASVHQPYLSSVLWMCRKRHNSSSALCICDTLSRRVKEACSMWRTVNMAVYCQRSGLTLKCCNKVSAAYTCYVLRAGLLKRRHERGLENPSERNKRGFSRKSQCGDKNNTCLENLYSR